MNKIYELFNPNSEYNRNLEARLRAIQQEMIENKECFICRHCIDISDDRNTCHLCEYTNDIIPEELTCLLWELRKE